MLRHPFFLSALFCTALGACAQTGTLKALPQWKAGDRRQVKVERNIRLTLDSATYQLTSSSTWAVEVEEVRKSGSTLVVRTLATDQLEADSRLRELLGGVAQDPARHFKDVVAQSLYQRLEGLPTRFDVTAEGAYAGPVDPVQAVERLRPAMAKLIPGMMADIARYRDREPDALTASNIDYLTDSLYNVLTAPQAQELVHLMRIHDLSFPLTGSQRVQLPLKNVQAPWGPIYTELPATVETGLDQLEEKRAVTRRVLRYLPEAWSAALAPARWNEGVKPETMSWTLECVEEFDRKSGWSTVSTSESDLRCGSTRIMETVTTTVENLY
jgi:hypothetical protein